MYLCDTDIRAAVEAGDIVLSDFNLERLQSVSYDICLSDKFLVPDTHAVHAIDPACGILPKYREVIIEPDGAFVLHPGVSVLGSSVDFFGSDKYLIHLSGKSSLARIGLIVHNTAGIINPGHFLNVTFELSNLNAVPIILRPGMKIAQLLFSTLSGTPERNYKQTGRYHNENWTGFVPERP